MRYANGMKPVLVCLHGWGGSKESFTELRAALDGTDIEILTPDLPGFGSELEPDRPWTTDDYAEWVERWLCQRIASSDQRIALHLLGHSHGGRIVIKLAAHEHVKRSSLLAHRFSLQHLYLCAAAGIRHPRHFKRIIGLTLAKVGAMIFSIPGLRSLQPIAKKFLYKLVRVHDYENASPIMRQTLINVSQEDLRPLLACIDVPTDIFWGTQDQMTPIGDAYVMHDAIKGSNLHIYPGIRHRVHRDKAIEIAQVIKKRLYDRGE